MSAVAPIRVAVAGAAGRMGRTLIEACRDAPDIELCAALECAGSPYLGQDAGIVARGPVLGIPITPQLEEVLNAFDVLVEFTVPAATLHHLSLCRAARRRMVIGTTGIPDFGLAAIQEAAHDCAIVFASNMSVGVNLCFKLLETAARALGPDYDVEIVEAHHRQKADAPSGTALKMGEIVARALNRNLTRCAVYDRRSTAGPRPAEAIGFASIRASDIVGEHTVLFAGAGERVEIVHKASDRGVFAHGALRAARWIAHRGPGLFDMQDVLGLRDANRP
ncbi:MAG: 4-hydroxy-tetrahydrodipicolinate reductase [Gammaproteobacteria bacterium]